MSKKHLLTELSKADYITVLATFLIVNAFWLLWNGQTYLAIAVTFTSMFLDYLDGRVARKFGGSPYGKVLDSLYDILGWVLFPALVVNIQTHWAWWSVIITTLYCLGAAIRLSRFTVAGYVETDKRYYTGMPVSYSRYALLVVLLAGAKISVTMLAIMIPLMVSSRLFRKSPPVLMQINLLYAAVFLFLYLKHA
jgi:CDP-diacylglycerol--serine O-phosphatidyltransferase